MDNQTAGQNINIRPAGQIIKPGLDRMKKMMAGLQPELKGIKFIHIAGTNGKGSLGSYCAFILASAGFKVGWFSSPHLQRKSECIRIMDKTAGIDGYLKDETFGEITPDELEKIDARITSAVNQSSQFDGDPPSEFERLTMAALLHFSAKKCDWVIWEAGMGGKDDATNIIESPAACMITSIGLDHVQWLGDSYEQIAEQKAGIIKHKCQVYLYDPQDAIPEKEAALRAEQIVKQKCEEEESDLHLVSDHEISLAASDLTGQIFRLKSDDEDRVYQIRQLGIYQPQLASMAVRLCRNMKIDDAFIVQGLSKAVWPGRMEVCREKSESKELILLDGAHNLQGCEALKKSLTRLLPDQDIIFLIGMLADKQSDQMIKTVFGAAGYTTRTVICTRPDNFRALPAAILAEKAAALIGHSVSRLQLDGNRMYNSPDHVFYSEDAAEAVKFALELSAETKQPLCVFGSLYLAGVIRPLLLAADKT